MTEPRDILLHLYRGMVVIRLCEEALIEPIISGAIRCPCHLYSGQEAIAVGLCANMTDEDYVFSNHRSHGHFLAKGGRIDALFAEIYGRSAGCSRGRGGSMHLSDPEKGMMGSAPIVAGTVSLALGSALASLIRREHRVSVSFIGDGATGEGVLYEAMNFASLKKLPIIFACENNFYATHMPICECRTGSEISNIAQPFGIASMCIDGNDVLEVYRQTREAIAQCRRGEGPVFIEFTTYRHMGHVGPNDNIQGTLTDIRPKQEIELWLQKDPVTRFEKYLLHTGMATDAELKKMQEAIRKEIDASHRLAMQSPLPGESELLAYVFK